MGSVAVVIPCLNEAAQLEKTLPRLKEALAALDVPARVYVVDGGSTDGSREVAAGLGACVLDQRGAGYGAAIATALECVDAPYLITMDAEPSPSLGILPYLYAMRDRAEIVIASRYMPQGHADMPWVRHALSRMLSAVFRRALSLPIYDVSSGYRLYSRAALAALRPELTSYAVLPEILVKAYCEGYRVREIPFHYISQRGAKRARNLFRLGRDYVLTLRKMWSLRNSIESADYDTRAFYSRIPLQRWWQRRRYNIMMGYIGDRLRVLDSGCGSSQLLNGTPQAVGVDIECRKLRFMRRPGRKLVNASTFALPFKDGVFEVVVCAEVIEHIPERPELFEELVRCLEPGGVLIVSTPDYATWRWRVIERLYRFFKPTGYADEHVTHYTRRKLEERFAEMGLTVEDHTYVLGADLIMKVRKPKPSALHDPG